MAVISKYFLVLLLFWCSCSSTSTKTWKIPLSSSDAFLEINLPNHFDTLKKSLHLSDCISCGKYHTVIGNVDFVESVEDTTEFLIPWLAESAKNTFLYIEEQRFPETQSGITKRNYKEELNIMTEMLNLEFSPHIHVLNQMSSDKFTMSGYETLDSNGRLTSVRIKYWTDIDNQPIRISFFQPKNSNGLYDVIWNELSKMKITHGNRE